jgi:tetratricopeptide (TPR) repeat protein
MEDVRSSLPGGDPRPAGPGPDGAGAQIGDLSRKLDVMKREIDELQIAAMNDRKPWYRNISTLLSIIALLFSFGTTLVSYRRTEAQDIQAQRADLRSMLQRLAALPKENFEVTLQHADNPTAVASLAGYVNQENAMLARQAAELARTLPPSKVSATEFYAVGLALQNSYNIDEAKYFFSRAIESAREFNDEIAAVRSYANLLFMTGQPEAGRVEYQKALSVFSNDKYRSYNDYTRNSTHAWTELSWAYAEANAGNYPLVQQHFANAEGYVARLQPGPSTEQIRSQLNQARLLLIPGAPPASPLGPVPGADLTQVKN